jgi:predicted transcriptional regulator
MTELKMNKMEVVNHWNDRFYESTKCVECGNTEIGSTIAKLEVAIELHECPTYYKGYCYECEHLVCHCEEYNLA